MKMQCSFKTGLALRKSALDAEGFLIYLLILEGKKEEHLIIL